MFYIICSWHKSRSIKKKIPTDIDPYYDLLKDMPDNGDYDKVNETLYNLLREKKYKYIKTQNYMKNIYDRIHHWCKAYILKFVEYPLYN